MPDLDKTGPRKGSNEWNEGHRGTQAGKKQGNNKEEDENKKKKILPLDLISNK